MAYVVKKDIALDSISEPVVLLADNEISNQPAHFTVVGDKGVMERPVFGDCSRLSIIVCAARVVGISRADAKP